MCQQKLSVDLTPLKVKVKKCKSSEHTLIPYAVKCSPKGYFTLLFPEKCYESVCISVASNFFS